MTRAKFTAFISDKDSINLFKKDVVEGNIRTAFEKLSGGVTPEYLLVELASDNHDEAFADLDKLANICEPDTQVIVAGKIDALSFYNRIMEMGVAEYMLLPVKVERIEALMNKKSAHAQKAEVPKHESKIISVVGTRGGVGSSTIAVNLAKLFANSGKPTVIMDFDPEFGTIPLMFDVEPSKGLVEALEKPERVDNLFLERVMTKVGDNLFVIGAEKNIAEVSRVNEKAAQVLLNLLKAKFEYIVVDVPRVESYDFYILQNAEDILVTELSIPGLRDTMRIYDLINEKLVNKKITLIANKVGINKKFETPLKDFEKGLGRKIDFEIAYEPEIYGFNNSGKILVDEKPTKFSASINKIAAKFSSGIPTAIPIKKTGLLDKLLKK